MKVQVCRACGKFRYCDDSHCWSHWQDVRNMTFEQGQIAQQSECPFCGTRRLIRKSHRLAALSERR